jgi:hypothetical protein
MGPDQLNDLRPASGPLRRLSGAFRRAGWDPKKRHGTRK